MVVHWVAERAALMGSNLAVASVAVMDATLVAAKDAWSAADWVDLRADETGVTTAVSSVDSKVVL